MQNLKKGILITVITVVVLVVVIIAFISPIAKYAIQKYDVKYLGREIKMGWLYLNPFTGYIHISNLKVYEPNSDSLIIKAAGLSAKFEVLKAFKKTYEISNISLDKPVAFIIQNRKHFNFSDLIERFTPKHKDTITIKEPVHFNILNIAVNDGEFHYTEQTIPINYFIKHVNISSTGKWWNTDSMNMKFALQSGIGTGDIKGTGSIYFNSLRYKMATSIVHFDLNLINQYLQDLANNGRVSAILDADLKASGSMKDGLDMDASGALAITDLHFGKAKGDDFFSCDKIALSAEKISPRQYEYILDSIMLGHPSFKYERYDHLNNIEKMFGEKGAKIKQAKAESEAGKFNLIIEIANYVKKIAVNFLQSHYTIDKVVVYHGDIKFNDFSLREKFSVEANPLYFRADSLDKNNKRLTGRLTMEIKPYSSIVVNLSLNPKNHSNFDLNYKIANVPVSMFNPYIISYTSFPLDRGTLEFNGYMHVVDSIIKSENHLLIIDPRVAKRVRKKDTKWIPVPFIMSLVRSSGNAIDFQIPIAGDLSNPKFKLWPVIGEVVKNIFVKPPSSGYLMHVKNVEQEVEKSLSLHWQMRQTELRPVQKKFVNRIAEYLQKNTEASIAVSPVLYEEKEREHILFFEAKKKFFLHTHNNGNPKISSDDSTTIEKMSVKDSLFVHYLDKLIGDSSLNTIQEKCSFIISNNLVNKQFNQLSINRELVFKSYFGEAASRVNFKNKKSTVPFNGFSFYRIDYNGEIPESLLKAYRQMEELNAESPREKYKEKRKLKSQLIK